MSFRKRIDVLFGGSLFHEPLLRLHDLYEQLDAEITSFQNISKLTCQHGCGSCCEIFMPDTLTIEALYCAAWILDNSPQLVEKLILNKNNVCPFYEKDNPLHCTIYGGRPLICRAFGYCAMLDKNGSIDFNLCFKMPNLHGSNRNCKGSDCMTYLGAHPPIMQQFGIQLASFLPDDSGERKSIVMSLPQAIEKISLLRYLKNQ